MNLAKKILAVLLAAAFMFSFAGCKKNNSDFFTYQFTPEPTVAPITTPMPDGSAQISVPMPKQIPSVNPFKVESRDLKSIYNLIFEPLLTFDEKGEPVPVLAQTWTLDEESGRKWVVKLRDDVIWQQTGRKLDAYDVEFTLDLMNQLRREQGNDYCEALGYISYWSVEDASTINIYSYEPFYGTIMALDFPILPRDVNYTLDTEPIIPVGTGPYEVTSWVPGEQVVLTLNTAWWQKAPVIGKIVAKPYDDNRLAVSALQLNQLDVVQTDEIALLATDQVFDIFSYEYVTNYYEFLAPNFRSLLLEDEKVRQAIAYALDRDEIVSNVYINHAIPVDTPVPPTSFLYTGRLLTYNNDVEEAKSLLRLAGWKYLDDGDPWLDVSPDGAEMDFTLRLVANSDTNSPHRSEVAQYVKKQLEKVGIKVEVVTVEWEEYKNMISEGRFDLILGGWYLNDIPDLRFAFKSDGSQNISGYKDAEMDEMLLNIMQQQTRQTLVGAYDTLQQKIIEDLPIISLYFRTHSLLTKKNITKVIQVNEDNAYLSIQYWEIK